MRVNLSLAIVPMTDTDSTNIHFAWNETIKGMLLSSFFWGHCAGQIPAGVMVHKFGGKMMLLWGMVGSIITNMLTPYGASVGDWPTICVLRVGSGLCQSVVFPAIFQLLAKWTPPDERTVLGTLAISGIHFGVAVVLSSGGVVSSSALGWAGIFYLSGGISLIWVLIWVLYVADSPDTCKSISITEKRLIEEALGRSSRSFLETTRMHVPWRHILKSCPFLAFTFVNCSNMWFFWTIATQISIYMNSIMGADIKANALLSALPYLSMFVMDLLCVALAVFLKKRQIMSTAVSRRLFSTLGMWIPAATLATIGYVKADQMALTVMLFTITESINSLTFLGFMCNHMDLSPNFAGILSSLATFVANFMSFLAPLTAGLILTNEKDQSEWRIIFIITSCYIFMGNLIFIIFGRYEVQPWNDPANM